MSALMQEAIRAAGALQGSGRYMCPNCGGGSDQEISLSIRLDTNQQVHWKCFRASCGYTGGPRGVKSVFAEHKKEARHYTRPIRPLSPEQTTIVHQKFGLRAQEFEGYNECDDRFILGVYGPVGYNRRGVLAYSLSRGTPKSLTYREKPEEPFIHYCGMNAITQGIVIVEDWFSAEKVGATGYGIGVALMGTNLTQAAVTEIAEVANRTGTKVWLAFDQDAYEKSLNYLFKYREQFPGGLFAWRLKQDLKYETTKRITEALVDGRTNFFDRTPNSGSDAKGQDKL